MKIKAWEIKTNDMMVLPFVDIFAGVKSVEYKYKYVRLKFYQGIRIELPENFEVEVINF